jgi:A/G-specific adenine glycosylase
MTAGNPASVRARLLAWYDAERRDLPWRARGGEAPDPYRVWLSEVMLQQTRVETVIPYFRRWLERFPTLESLARAPAEEVMRSWEGLGYYSRARNFHRAVREVVGRYGARVPEGAEELRALPGVGRYTAGAVASIAFGREEPVVDGNVRRVLARWADEAHPREAELWERAAALARGPRPGDLNQALMELGALVCTPRRPRCGSCPAAAWCGAHAAGTAEERPERRRRAPLRHDAMSVAVVIRDGAVLLARRPESVLLGGLWELPGTEIGAGETAAAAAERVARERLGVEVIAERELGTVRHVFTHLRATYHAVACRWRSGEPRAVWHVEAGWVPRDALDGHALPVAQRKLLALVRDAGV